MKCVLLSDRAASQDIGPIVMKICGHMKDRKINGGNCHVFSLVFFIEDELFTENGGKGSAVNKPVGERFDLHSRYSYQSERKCLLQKSIGIFLI